MYFIITLVQPPPHRERARPENEGGEARQAPEINALQPHAITRVYALVYTALGLSPETLPSDASRILPCQSSIFEELL